MSHDQLLQPPQVCRILNISKRTLQRITQEGKLPSIKIRGSTRYTQDAVDELIKSGGVQDDKWRSLIRKMRPIRDLADAAKKEWERGATALLAFHERLERAMFGGGISSTLRAKIAEIDSLIAEEQASLGVLRELCLLDDESTRNEPVSGSGGSAEAFATSAHLGEVQVTLRTAKRGGEK